MLPEIVVEQTPVPREQSMYDPIELAKVFVHVPLDLQFTVGRTVAVNPAEGMLVI
jgi:hypothetical protein